MSETVNDIFAVLVLYKTHLKNSATFNTLSAALQNQSGVLDLLVYNNSPEIKVEQESGINASLNLMVIEDYSNSGVSKAYNMAHAIAKSKKKKWLLLFDQDTRLPADFFSFFLLQRKKDIENTERVYIPIIKTGSKMVSPANYFMYRGFIKKRIEPGTANIKNLAIINSGVIIDNTLFEQTGGFNEDITVDFSDVSFFRRLKKVHSRAFILKTTCDHSFSGFAYDNYNNCFNRFRIYNDNAIAFSREKGVIKIFLFLQVIVRALNLSLKFRTLNFLNSLKY